MKINKETRKLFLDEYAVGLRFHKIGTNEVRHSYSDLKKVYLVLSEFERIKSLKRDVSCGCVKIAITGGLNGVNLRLNVLARMMACFRGYAKGVSKLFSFIAKRNGEEVNLNYSREIQSLKDGYRFMFESFVDFALKADSIKMKKCTVDISYKDKWMSLSFFCE